MAPRKSDCSSDSNTHVRVHWLLPLELTLKQLHATNLASVRLRAAVAADAFHNCNIALSTGGNMSDFCRVVIVGKIGADNVEIRSRSWMAGIANAKKRGAIIVIDYTDHHLGQQSTMQEFYRRSFEYADIVIVPSRAMRDNLQAFWRGQIAVIPDAIEYKVRAPLRRGGELSTALWFGHPSNLEYLVQFLQYASLEMVLKALVICTDARGINWIQSNPKYFGRLHITPALWTVQALEKLSCKCDLALLPTGLNDPRKSGASENRLITAIALGLPVVTHSLSSYEPYRKYYSDINGDDYMAVIKNPSGMHNLVLEAQKQIIPKYYPSTVGLAWRNFILKCVENR